LDVNEYISSGILESYVLGAASNQEQREVQCLSSIYPEIAEALQALNNDMENFAQSLAQAPPSSLKEKIMSAIQNVKQESPLLPAKNISSETKVVEPAAMTVTKTKRPWLAAASLAALIALTAIFFVNQNNQQKELAAVTDKLESVEQNALELSEINSLLASSATNKIQLNGTEGQPDSKFLVFWNTESQDVAFTIENLPELPTDKDYQLWAIVDGKPTDMGVIDYASALSTLVKSEKKISAAQAFAITVEPKGGSKNPTLTSMVVVGNT